MTTPNLALSDWQTSLSAAQSALQTLDAHIAAMNELRNRAVAEIAKHIRASGAAELDLDAIAQTVTRPYTLLPTGKRDEWYVIQWRGIKMPMHIGWLEKQEDAFNLFRVTRSMNLLTPFPEWLKTEMGVTDPEHSALVDGTRTGVRVTRGDAASFKKRYGAHLGKQNADGSFAIKPGDAWIKLVAQLVKDGILPYQPKPVAAGHWDAQGAPALDPNPKRAGQPIVLRDYQRAALDEFLSKGAVFINHPTGAGKGYTVLYILGHFRGNVLLLSDTSTAIEQWRDSLKISVPHARVITSTYQGASKYINQHFDLLILNEAHRAPANTFSKLAFIDATYRIGDTATPWREDDRQHLIVALSGFPVHVPWAQLIRAGVLKKPHIVVETHKDAAAKTQRVKTLLAQRPAARALIFCDWIQEGQTLANALGVPFVHGETKNKLQQIRNAPVCVVSRIADTALDLTDLTLVIDYGFMQNARTQGAQRMGRLLHSEKGGEYRLLLTAAEASNEPRRLWGIEQELMGEVDIEHLDFTVTGQNQNARSASREPAARLRAPSAPLKTRAAAKPQSEIDQILTNRAVQRALTQAYALATARVRKSNTIHAVVRLGWDEPFSLDALLLSGRVKKDWISTYKNACDIAVAQKLMARVGDGYQTHRAFLNQLVRAAERFNT